MMKTDTTERGLERLICTALAGDPCDPQKPDKARETEGPSDRSGGSLSPAGGVGWIGGYPEDYDREYCVDLAQLSAFLRETQPEAAEALALG